jgi:hypothetical protein
MSNYEEEIEGREFDWYAVDSDRNIAIFTTAGEGSLPEEVLKNYKLHDEITDSLESPNWGSSEVWSDYSKLGLYVFDWDLPEGPYKRERIPNTVVATELKSMILKAAVKFEIRFADIKEFKVPLNSMSE